MDKRVNVRPRRSVLLAEIAATHIYTGSGIKEWCYYARDYDLFMEELNNALEQHPLFPIEILQHDDPTWKYWRGIKEFATGEEE